MDFAALVDTNVLLRLLQPAHVHYRAATAAIADLGQQSLDLCIVPQNLVEFRAVATRPLVNNGLGMSPLAIASEMRGLRNLFRLLEGTVGIADAWEKLVVEYLVSGKQAHDAHLVAAMNVHGVRRILTFNGEDFRRYDGIEIIVPALAAV